MKSMDPADRLVGARSKVMVMITSALGISLPDKPTEYAGGSIDKHTNLPSLLKFPCHQQDRHLGHLPHVSSALMQPEEGDVTSREDPEITGELPDDAHDSSLRNYWIQNQISKEGRGIAAGEAAVPRDCWASAWNNVDEPSASALQSTLFSYGTARELPGSAGDPMPRTSLFDSLDGQLDHEGRIWLPLLDKRAPSTAATAPALLSVLEDQNELDAEAVYMESLHGVQQEHSSKPDSQVTFPLCLNPGTALENESDFLACNDDDISHFLGRQRATGRAIPQRSLMGSLALIPTAGVMTDMDDETPRKSLMEDISREADDRWI